MSGIIADLAESVVRGGIIKKGIKAAGEALKKGFKRGGIRTVRGLKSSGAIARALPGALVESGSGARAARSYFGAAAFNNRDVMREFSRILGENLSLAGTRALNADALQRVINRLVKIGSSKQQSAVLRTILQNARKNETWAKYLARNANSLSSGAKALVQSIIREGGENIIIDKTATSLLKATAGISTAATGAVIGAKLAGGNKSKPDKKKKKKKGFFKRLFGKKK
tara:strand:- start:423 stop:1103 length:681 start_codon:yes stop_codon:yes gene_type:complete